MNLARKIILPMAGSIIVVIGLLIWQNVKTQTDLLTAKDAAELEGHYGIFTALLDEHEEKMLALSNSVANIPDVQQAFAERDREELARLLLPSFQALQETGVSIFHFHVPPATSFLRLHEPEMYGDDLSYRSMVVAVNAEHEPLTGAEAGVAGLALRGMVPVRYQGEHVGSVEFGQPMGREFLEHVKRRTQGDLTIYVTEETATIAMTDIAAELGTDAPAGFLVYDSTSDERLPVQASLYQEVVSTGEKIIVQVSSQGHSYSVMLVPLLDYEGNVAAVVEFVVSRDVLFNEIARNRNTNLLVGGIFIAGLSLGLGLYMSRSILFPISRLQQGTEFIGSGDLTHRLDIKSGDEIGVLAANFNEMADRLQQTLAGLEQRVAERTVELTKANEQLEREIAERVRMEAALREMRDYLDKLIRYASAPIIIWNPALEITRFNGAFEHLAGYSADEVIGQELSILFPEASRDESLREISRTSSGEHWESVEIPILRKDGKTRLVLWNSANIYAEVDTTLLATVAQGIDITDRKRAEVALREYSEHLAELVAERTAELNERVAEVEKLNRAMTNLLADLQSANRNLEETTGKLEAANEELEAFAYSVSHDLRAPLRHIDGFVQRLLKREEERLDPTSSRYLDIIAASSAKMGQLIDDLLTFSRTGRAEMKTRRVELNELLRRVQQELDPMPEGRQITWEISPLPAVEADPALLRQVWVNLLSNAIKFTGPRSEPRIEVGIKKPGFSEKPSFSEVTIFVRDNGVGFDPQYRHKLFGVFQRLHREDEFEGTGIGLATVRRIIHRHGGRVWAEGESDRGATFYFTLREAEGE